MKKIELDLYLSKRHLEDFQGGVGDFLVLQRGGVSMVMDIDPVHVTLSPASSEPGAEEPDYKGMWADLELYVLPDEPWTIKSRVSRDMWDQVRIIRRHYTPTAPEEKEEGEGNGAS